MDAETMRAGAVDPGWKWLYRVGAPPTGGEAWLTYLEGKTTVWWAILWLSVVTDLLYVPVAFALYVALSEINRGAMLMASAFVGFFVALDLAVTWSNYASLLVLGGNYAAAADDVERTVYVAAANYPSAVLASPLQSCTRSSSFRSPFS